MPDTKSDVAYFTRRAEEEAYQAILAASEATAAIHHYLCVRYMERVRQAFAEADRHASGEPAELRIHSRMRA